MSDDILCVAQSLNRELNEANAKQARIEAVLEDDAIANDAATKRGLAPKFVAARRNGIDAYRTRLREIVQEAAPEARSGDESPQGGKAPAPADNGSGGAESAPVGQFDGSGRPQ